VGVNNGPRSLRHVVWIAAICAVGTGGLAVACGGSDRGTAVIGEDGGGGEGSARDGGGTPAEDDTDGGIFMAGNDAGCPLKFAGPNPGTLAASIPRPDATGGIAWQSPMNALTVNGAFAHADVSNGQQTELLRVTGYGFDLPSTVTIKGVVVELRRQGADQIVDGNVELWLDGATSSRPKVFASGWPASIGTHHYGQEVDTWGDPLTPALVGKPGFGTEIWARRRDDAGTGPAPADVESLLITIWYCD
jgi:hypothetical protein